MPESKSHVKLDESQHTPQIHIQIYVYVCMLQSPPHVFGLLGGVLHGEFATRSDERSARREETRSALAVRVCHCITWGRGRYCGPEVRRRPLTKPAPPPHCSSYCCLFSSSLRHPPYHSGPLRPRCPCFNTVADIVTVDVCCSALLMFFAWGRIAWGRTIMFFAWGRIAWGRM